MDMKQTQLQTNTPVPVPENPNENTKSNQQNHAVKVVNQVIDHTYNHMDDHNKKAVDVMRTQGMNAAIQHMFTDQETGRQLSYGEMRARYG